MKRRHIVTGIGIGIMGLVWLSAHVGCSTRAPSVAIRMTDTVAPDVACRMTQLCRRRAETYPFSPTKRSR
jgi:hypothetical protein